MNAKDTRENGPASFKSVVQADVPRGREGKHKQIVSLLLNEIAQLKPGMALKVPLSELAGSKENIRSALNRATRQKGMAVSTASDDEHLYIWKPEKKAHP